MNVSRSLPVVCPSCLAESDASAETCARCGQRLEGSKRASETEGAAKLIDRPWLMILLVLHLGLLGIPLYWKSSYSLARRIQICLASIAYTVFVLFAVYWLLCWLYQSWTELRTLFNG
jgi:hypothetical protein